MYQIDYTLQLNLRGSTVNNKGNGDEATKKHEKRRWLENRGSGWRRPYLRRRRCDGEKPSGRSCDAGVRAATLAKQKRSRVRQPEGNETRRGRRIHGWRRSRRCSPVPAKPPVWGGEGATVWGGEGATTARWERENPSDVSQALRRSQLMAASRAP
jgi:hypothetical protein